MQYAQNHLYTTLLENQSRRRTKLTRQSSCRYATRNIEIQVKGCLERERNGWYFWLVLAPLKLMRIWNFRPVPKMNPCMIPAWTQTDTKVVRVGQATGMNSKQSEFIFRLVSCKRKLRNIWIPVRIQTGLSLYRHSVNTLNSDITHDVTIDWTEWYT